MLTEKMIKLYAGDTIYSRGLQIYNQQDKILQFEVEEDDEEDWIRGIVAGSGKITIT